jgi:hypothetical protein
MGPSFSVCLSVALFLEADDSHGPATLFKRTVPTIGAVVIFGTRYGIMVTEATVRTLLQHLKLWSLSEYIVPAIIIEVIDRARSYNSGKRIIVGSR